MRVHNRSFGMRDLLYLNNLKAVFQVAYENIRFSTLFVAGDVSFLRAKRPSGSDPISARSLGESGRQNVLSVYLLVTSQLMVESRNDRAENAWGLGCQRWRARRNGCFRRLGFRIWKQIKIGREIRDWKSSRDAGCGMPKITIRDYGIERKFGAGWRDWILRILLK